MRAQTRPHTPVMVFVAPGVASHPPVVGSLLGVVEAGSVMGAGSFVPAASPAVLELASLGDATDGVVGPPPVPAFVQPDTAIAKAIDAQTGSSLRFITTA